jgi:2-polyprenyl-3-methyl-5-hydroxy-6-metoxy-1,4-benzoquinol methylase
MQPRACPLCKDDAGEILMELEAEEFCRSNWTYARDFRAILALPSRAIFPIHRCVRCRFVYAALLPDEEFLAKLYDSVISQPHCVEGSENRTSYARRLRYSGELLELSPDGRALDYGSGVGVTSRILAACGVEALAFDPSIVRLSHSRQAGVNATTEMDEVRRQSPYAMLVLDNVLEHLPDPAGVVESLGALAVPQAVAYVSVPAYEETFLRRQVEAHRTASPINMTLNPWEHLNYFTLNHLDDLMMRGGFQRISASARTTGPVIGLRAEQSGRRRAQNGLATILRLAKYVVTGDVLPSAEHVFYRRTG